MLKNIWSSWVGVFVLYTLYILYTDITCLTQRQRSPTPHPPTSFPFKWARQGFTYLGIFITPSQMYKTKFNPLLRWVHEDLDRWTPLPLSMLGRIALIKMIVLPTFLYLFQMIPILLSSTIIKRINGWFSSFIWNRRKPRLKLSKMQLPRNKGDLAVPDARLYQLVPSFAIFLIQN